MQLDKNMGRVLAFGFVLVALVAGAIAAICTWLGLPTEWIWKATGL